MQLAGYFDNSATTFVRAEVAEKITGVLLNHGGNPSSLHQLGLDAELEVRRAADALAVQIGARREEIFFTSGGTESNNLAILGGWEARRRRGNMAVASLAEHASVLDTVRALESKGAACRYAVPRPDGGVDPHEAAALCDEKTILASFMLVNNETGGRTDIARLAALVRERSPQALIHCDAVSALGKEKIDVAALGVDLMSVSAHKIYGPKGVGALYIRRGVRISPLFFGGHQQSQIRPGTESVPLIAGFGCASEFSRLEYEENLSHARLLRSAFLSRFAQIEGVRVSSGEQCSPYVLNVSTNRIRSETMLHYLEQRDFYVSSGSACGRGAKSHVLTAISLDARAADTALRISFGRDNTAQQATMLADTIAQGMKELRSAYK